MCAIDINVTNGGRYSGITKIDDKEISSFESEKALGEYLLEHPIVELKPVSGCTSAIMFAMYISSINFKY